MHPTFRHDFGSSTMRHNVANPDSQWMMTMSLLVSATDVLVSDFIGQLTCRQQMKPDLQAAMAGGGIDAAGR